MKISQLGSVASPQLTDVLPLVSGGVTQKVTISQINSLFTPGGYPPASDLMLKHMPYANFASDGQSLYFWFPDGLWHQIIPTQTPEGDFTLAVNPTGVVSIPGE